MALKYTEPEVYNDIVLKLEESKEEQDLYIKDISKVLTKALNKEKIKYVIKGRPKSIFSIRRKMQNQGVSFEEVYDKFAVRIIINQKKKTKNLCLESVFDCHGSF